MNKNSIPCIIFKLYRFLNFTLLCYRKQVFFRINLTKNELHYYWIKLTLKISSNLFIYQNNRPWNHSSLNTRKCMYNRRFHRTFGGLKVTYISFFQLVNVIEDVWCFEISKYIYTLKIPIFVKHLIITYVLFKMFLRRKTIMWRSDITARSFN